MVATMLVPQPAEVAEVGMEPTIQPLVRTVPQTLEVVVVVEHGRPEEQPRLAATAERVWSLLGTLQTIRMPQPQDLQLSQQAVVIESMFSTILELFGGINLWPILQILTILELF